MKNLTYIVLWLLFQLIIEINCQMTPFNPNGILSHTATHIDDKFYILGGLDVPKVNIFGKDFFYHDVSNKFNTKELQWKDLSNINIVPSHLSATSVKGGSDNDTLFLYLGLPK